MKKDNAMVSAFQYLCSVPFFPIYAKTATSHEKKTTPKPPATFLFHTSTRLSIRLRPSPHISGAIS